MYLFPLGPSTLERMSIRPAICVGKVNRLIAELPNKMYLSLRKQGKGICFLQKKAGTRLPGNCKRQGVDVQQFHDSMYYRVKTN